MKKVLTLIITILIIACTVTPIQLLGQTPQKISYQAVIRDANNNLVTNQEVGMQISILQSSASGTSVYVETHTPTTNTNGLVSIEIGTGDIKSGEFTSIDWSNDSYFINTETDPTGGTNYIITGVSQLLSVPYALHAKTAESIEGGITETDPVYIASQAKNITDTDITNLSNLSGTNTGDQDITGIATNTQAIQDTASQIRADFPDINGFVSTETDPEFTAWGKDYDDIINTPATITTAQATEIIANTAKNTYPTVDVTKLAGIEAGAQVNVNTDWEATTGNAQIVNKPDLSVYLTTEVDGSSTNEIQNLTQVLIESNDAGAQIKNVTDPTDAQDAATKSYVDQLVSLVDQMQGQISELELLAGIQEIEDSEGNSYPILKIGDQIWMKENLKVTKYADGTPITGVYAYDNDEAIAEVYGKLYTWDAAMDIAGDNSAYTSGIQGVCPTDWHVPSDDEWKDLEHFLGMPEAEIEKVGWRGTSEGGQLKEKGLIHWDSPNEGATNSSGFTALPSGYKSYDSPSYYGKRMAVYFWLSDEYDIDRSYSRVLATSIATIARIEEHRKDYGFSVRCLKDNFDPNLVLWNKLGNEIEVQKSVIGENGTIVGTVNFNNDVKFKKGITPNTGSAGSGVDFPTTVVDPEQGAVEMWTKFYEAPVANNYGVYGFINVGHWSHNVMGFFWHNSNSTLQMDLSFNGTIRSTSITGFTPVTDEPVHMACVWDRNGIDGSGDYLRIYINGVVVTTNTTDNDWGIDNSSGNFRIAAPWDNDFATDRYSIDNIKVWNFAKTDFSDRNRE